MMANSLKVDENATELGPVLKKYVLNGAKLAASVAAAWASIYYFLELDNYLGFSDRTSYLVLLGMICGMQLFEGMPIRKLF